MPPYTLPSLRDVDKAARLIADKITQTPVRESSILSKLASTNLSNHGSTSGKICNVKLFFKCENLQRTGSFKYRGASHFLARLENHELLNGVVAYSTGKNHDVTRNLSLMEHQGIMLKQLPMQLKSRHVSAICIYPHTSLSHRTVHKRKLKQQNHTTPPSSYLVLTQKIEFT